MGDARRIDRPNLLRAFPLRSALQMHKHACIERFSVALREEKREEAFCITRENFHARLLVSAQSPFRPFYFFFIFENLFSSALFPGEKLNGLVARAQCETSARDLSLSRGALNLLICAELFVETSCAAGARAVFTN